MVHFYIGLMAYRMGDYWMARAGFNNALLADKASQEGYRDDFAAAHYMLGRTYQMLGDNGNARVAFKKARKAAPGRPILKESRINRDNLIIVAELGKSPIKYRTGPQESMDDFKKSEYPEAYASLIIKDKKFAKSYMLTDLAFEASTRGMSEKDAIQATKGAVHEGVHESAMQGTGSTEADIALLATDLALALSGVAKADIRQWDLLPGEIQIMSTYLKPGTYDGQIRFYDGAGSELGYTRIEQEFKVEPGIKTLYFYRSVSY
jgi:tetratricopeptide (TPR) repeat protein